MNTDIKLNARSIALISKLSNLLESETLSLQKDQALIRRDALLAWFSKEFVCDTNAKMLVESLRASLLEDLYDSLLTDAEVEDKKEEEASWYALLVFAWLVFSGTVLAICEGFDGVAALLGVFTAVPAMAILISGLAFSALSVVVFYSFDLVAISKNIGIKLTSSPQLIDIFLEQTTQIELLRNKIDDQYLAIKDEDELSALNEIVQMLKYRYQALDEARDVYKNALEDLSLYVAKSMIAAMTGMLFLAGGFFAGQSLALVVAGFFLATLSATSLPVLLTSIVVGLSAFSLYWYLERPGVENMISRLFGLDKETIDKFAGDDVVKQHKHELDKLSAKLEDKIIVQKKIIDLHHTINGYSLVNNLTQIATIPTSDAHYPGLFSLKRSKSMSDLGAAVAHHVAPGL